MTAFVNSLAHFTGDRERAAGVAGLVLGLGLSVIAGLGFALVNKYGLPTIPLPSPTIFFSGLGFTDVALLLQRVALGGFFFLARFRWVYDPSRAWVAGYAANGEPQRGSNDEAVGRTPWFAPYRVNHLTWKLCSCGYGKHPVLSGFVALVEISAGLALVVGLLTPLASLGLLGTLGFATYCTAKEKVRKQNPVDHIDCVACYLWTVEPLYIVLALSALINGAGAYSLDAVIRQLLA